jgi:hypothetical protein
MQRESLKCSRLNASFSIKVKKNGIPKLLPKTTKMKTVQVRFV